ncbi:MAG: DNA phosphorothioation system sulfurtransferase DndC [Nitrososphaerota archaeon]|nr:DNA phosphorothioation system sulfurtransferase DndC [Nitrososphaerota archaeon]
MTQEDLITPFRVGSVFDTRSLGDILREIQEVYLQDQRPWVIGFSGGKDSTCTLQLVWDAIQGLPKNKRTKAVHVISSDTLVETPVIVNLIDGSLERIRHLATEKGLPFTATKVQPAIGETFWVNLIGRGYPAPYRNFRWCTDRMKIQPADRFILEQVSKSGEVVVVLGVRRQESMTRAQLMSLSRIKGSLFSRHRTLPNTFVYTPIAEFSTEDVWEYLLQNPNPWGNNNRDLLALYKSANAGECPLVVDDTTPSCGNSRFGCWVCTVVSKDHAMEALVDGGERWMLPLLEFRNLLASTQDPTRKAEYRDAKRRNGQMKLKSDGSPGFARGPYRFEFRKDLLRRLLDAQKTVQASGPGKNMELIRHSELEEIRRIWRRECGDWDDSVPKIYMEVFGRELDWLPEDLGAFTADDAELLRTACEKNGVPPLLVARLLDVEREVQGMAKRASVYVNLSKILREEWRTESSVLEELTAEARDTGGRT